MLFYLFSADLRVTRDTLTVRGRDGTAPPISMCIGNKVYEFASGTTRVFSLNSNRADTEVTPN